MTYSRDVEVANLGKPGFNAIRIIISAINKPIVEFSMPNTAENWLYLQQGGVCYGPQQDQFGKEVHTTYLPGGNLIAAAGTVTYDAKQIKLKVTGKTSTYLALDNYLREAIIDMQQFSHFIDCDDRSRPDHAKTSHSEQKDFCLSILQEASKV